MSSSSTIAKKQTKGRQKIEIKRMENQSNRQVTFSKRRAGLFKKASELCILTGSAIAIIIISPSKKVFSFGSPNLQSIINRYVGQSDNEDKDKDAAEVVNIEQENKEYKELLKTLEKEKKITTLLKARKKAREMFWWQEEKNIEEMGMEELEEYVRAVEELKKNLSLKGNAMRTSTAAN